MIQGFFDDAGHPKIKIVVGGSREQVEIETLIDTGFDGEITIPSIIGVRLGLEVTSLADFELADGSIVQRFIFSGQVTWGGQSRRADIILADSD